MELDDISVVADGLAFPEGPVVLPDGSVAVVEIRGGRVSRCWPDGTVSVIADVGGGPNGAAVGPDGFLYICNNGGVERAFPPCIQRLHPDGGPVETLYGDCDGEPLSAPNDLVFDDTGHFWFTDYFNGHIFYASPRGDAIVRAIEGLVTPNGVGLSPDGATLYWSQTDTRQVLRRPLVGPGKPVPSTGCNIGVLMMTGSVDPDTVIVGLPGVQELDSLAVEAGGSICVGTLVDSGITVVAPDGSSVEKYTLPAELADGAVTNICFGGDDLRTAYLTLSMTGRLVSCRWPRPGLRLQYP